MAKEDTIPGLQYSEEGYSSSWIPTTNTGFFCAFEEKLNGPKSNQNSTFDQNSTKKHQKLSLPETTDL